MMDFSLLKRSGLKLLPVLLTLTAIPGQLKATNIFTLTPTSGTLACNTATGTTPLTVNVKSIAAPSGSGTVVTFTASSPLVVTPSTATLTSSNNSTGVNFTVTLPAGCVGVTNSSSKTIVFSAGANADSLNPVTITTSITATTSGLSASPTTATVTCVYNSGGGGSYSFGPAQTISITSGSNLGTPFSVDTSTNPVASWLSVTPTTGGTATSSPTTFTVQAQGMCNSYTDSTSHTTTTIHLLNSPAPDKTITVTLQMVPATPLTATPSTPSFTYVKGSGTPGYADVVFTSSVNAFFLVNTATMPSWLTATVSSGTATTTGKSIRFSSTSLCDSLAPGSYSAAIHVQVSGYGDAIVNLTMLLNNAAPKLSVQTSTSTNPMNINWTIGSNLPTPVITAFSSDTPIQYTVTTAGTLAPIVANSQLSGLAYSFGTPINVSFNPLIFGSAAPNTVLTGTVTLSWGSAPISTVVVTINITVLSPASSVTALSPATLPTANAPTSFQVSMTGSGFIPGTDPSVRTKVGIVSGGSIVLDSNITYNIVNSSNILLTISVPAVADANLPFSPSGTGGSVILGVCNPVGGTCSTATGTATLAIGNNPIVQAVTSSSALIQGNSVTIAPYDMISLFGQNFCSSNSTGCTTSTILYGTPVNGVYPTTLSPDGIRSVSVNFFTHGTTTLVGGASTPLLFATNNQINLIVPGELASLTSISGGVCTPGTVDMVVAFGTGAFSSATQLKSATTTLNVGCADPGIFTVGADGQGSIAALDPKYNLVSATNPANMRNTAADSDYISIYMTGLGAPDSAGTNNGSPSGTSTWPTDCSSVSAYLTSAGATSADGLILNPSYLETNGLLPCLRKTTSGGSAYTSAQIPTITVGGLAVPATSVLYAGWVANTVAGLYQVTFTLPSSTASSGTYTTYSGASVATLTAPVQLPITVTTPSGNAQAGVYVWVQPSLKVTGPIGSGLSGTVGILWPTTVDANDTPKIVATEGSGPYRYAITSGVLPAGLTLTAGGAGSNNYVSITGTPAAGSGGMYLITVTATDSANVPVKGSVTFTLSVTPDLFITYNNPTNISTYGTATALGTIVPTGGVYPYTYSLTPTGVIGLAVSNGGAVTTSAVTPAGTYPVVVTATDSTSGSPLTGSYSFTLTEALKVVATNVQTPSQSTGGLAAIIRVSGNTGSLSYSLDNTSSTLGFAIDSSGNLTLGSSNTATASTPYSITVTVTDGSMAASSTANATGTVTVTITPGT